MEASYLIEIWRSSLQLSSHHQHRLQGSQAEVVVRLLGQLLAGQFVKNRHLLGQNLHLRSTDSPGYC